MIHFRISIAYLIVTFILLLSENVILAQSESASVTSSEILKPVADTNSVNKDNLKAYLSVLAADSLEGRETGTEGNRKAADYIVSQFKKFGIAPISSLNGFEQQVAFTWTSWKDISLSINEIEFKHLWDFIAVSSENNNLPAFEADQVIFLGYGIDDLKYSDYKDVDVKDKVILIYKGEPQKNENTFWISGTSEKSEWNNNIDKKVMTAYNHGVKLVLLIEDDIKKQLESNRRKILGNSMTLGLPSSEPLHKSNFLQVSTNIAKAIIGTSFDKLVKKRDKINKKGKPESMVLDCELEIKIEKQVRTLEGSNVLAYVEGQDPVLKNELVVVTAHYDHLGKKGENIYNGADDNGSGTASVMELARIYAANNTKGKGSARSILFMLVTGEEKGLLGSEFYVNNPVFPLESSIANVNIDMIGRVDEKHTHQPEYIYVIGSDRLSTELHSINEEMNKKYTRLELDYTFNAESDPNRYYYRSDHYNFAERGIPAIFYFSGTHVDYHRPGDTVDKIDFERMEKIGQLIYHVIYELANREQRIKVDVPTKSKP